MRKSIIVIMVLSTLSSIAGCSYQEVLGSEILEEKANELSYEDNIKEYLSRTVEEIVELTGDDINTDGTKIVFEPNIFYPCIFLEDEPFAVICRSNDKSLNPIYVSFYDNKTILNPLNLRKNMDFSEIMLQLGETPVECSGNADYYYGGNFIYK